MEEAPLRRFASLKLELVAMAMVLVLVMSGTMGLTMAWIYSRALGENQVKAAEALANGAASVLINYPDWRSFPWAELDRGAALSGLRLLLVAENQGRELFRAESAGPRDETVVRAALASGRSQTAFDGRRLSAAVPVMSQGRIGGAICLGGQPATFQSAERAARFWMPAALGINIVLMGLFLAFYLNRRLLAPIRELAGDLEDLGRDRFRPHLRAWTSREINELFQAFDQAAVELMDSRRRLEEQLQTIQDTQGRLVASEKMAAVGRLASGLAHELGNPIGALTGFVHLLRQGGLSSDDRALILSHSAQELQRMDGSLKELLHFSRPARGRAEPVDAAQTAAAALSLARPQKWAEGVDFSLDCRLVEPLVLAERNSLLQVLLNLLANAGQALEGQNGPRTVGLVVEAAEGGRAVSLKVRDNGPGVAEEDVPRLFEPYFTRKEPGQGTGLGLAISLSIIESFGGRLEFSPAGGGGAVFAITLPVPSGPQG
ncbi:MAG: hypothetical protein LBP33_06540 [Candidatus Adiutrix sp.]|jgi:signal transduction histidine kinase|nr:hypothetical protein [Candidatus Adiutrix sp.]